MTMVTVWYMTMYIYCISYITLVIQCFPTINRKNME